MKKRIEDRGLRAELCGEPQDTGLPSVIDELPSGAKWIIFVIYPLLAFLFCTIGMEPDLGLARASIVGMAMSAGYIILINIALGFPRRGVSDDTK